MATLGAECAALLLVQGVPARVVMETLGHSNISITMDTYTHVLPELLLQLLDLLPLCRVEMQLIGEGGRLLRRP